MKKTIFLSHIHEEKDLALIIQKAVENEFSGFVKVFVSSDGSSIPAGSNFLTTIEDALLDCSAGLYLISPYSIKRNWINFELGALWIRNVMSVRTGEAELPTIPICHSGIAPSELPMPLTNLNSINGLDRDDLERMFKNLQGSLGGSGELKTDFEALQNSMDSFCSNYTLIGHLINVFKTISATSQQMIPTIEHSNNIGKGQYFDLTLGDIPQAIFDQVHQIIQEHFEGEISVSQEGQATSFADGSAVQNAISVTMNIKSDILIDYGEQLLIGLN